MHKYLGTYTQTPLLSLIKIKIGHSLTTKGVIDKEKLVFGAFPIEAIILFQHSGEASKQGSISSDY